MSWDKLSDDIIEYIIFLTKLETLKSKAAIKIQSKWKCYKLKILIKRFKTLRYLKDFKIWNPNIQDFLLRSRL
jgi:hypothetical protein